MSADVSIIIAAYNVERYIDRAVKSALAQEGVSVEVVLVDDCSTDGTWGLASSIGDGRLKCLQLARNGGPSAARNAGIAAATGAWVAVLDGDDALEPGRLAACLKRAKEARADIVVDNLTICREEDGATFPMFRAKDFPKNGLLGLADFIAGNSRCFGGYTLGYLKPVFSAAFLKKHLLSYDPDVRVGEDYLLLAGALACGAVCAVEKTAGYLYTARAGSISHRLVPGDVLRIMTGDENFLSRHDIDGKARRAQKRRTLSLWEAYAYTLLVDAIKRRDLKGIARSLWICPTAARHLWLPVKARLFRAAAFLKEKRS